MGRVLLPAHFPTFPPEEYSGKEKMYGWKKTKSEKYITKQKSFFIIVWRMRIVRF
jgi:hypothetical protein